MEGTQKFVLCESSSVGFSSSWKHSREISVTAMQTDAIQVEGKNLQCVSSKSIAVQTDLGKSTETRGLAITDPYPPSLFAFFAKTTDKMCKCLEENMDPFASEVFKDFGEEDSESSIDASKEFTLRNINVSDEFGGSCLSWNKEGTQIAIGYSASSHDGWCCHQVPISVWNLHRPQNFDENVPHAQRYLPCCISTIEFHPINSSIIAVGLHSGQVALVDFYSAETTSLLKKEVEEDLPAENTSPEKRSSKITDPSGDLGYFIDSSGHSLTVTTVQWIRLTASQSSQLIKKNNNPSQCCLISSGKDGYICLWSTNTSITRLVLEKKFIVWSDSIPEDVSIGNRTQLRMKEVGILALSSCKDDPLAFIFTSFGGFIFQGNLDGDIEAYTAMAELVSPEDSLSPETLYDPGAVMITKHDGCTNVIDCSPFHRNVFLSAITSGTVIIQNVLEPTVPMAEYSIEVSSSGTLNDAKWSFKPTMFAVACENTVKVYDLKIGKQHAISIHHENVISKIAFNKTQLGTLASCDTRGYVYIWRLPPTLSSHEPHELDVLISLSHRTKANES